MSLYPVYPPRMATDMRKTHSYLKGLAETRARADGDAQRLQQVLKEVKRKLAEATANPDSCDLLIRKFDGRLDPSQIAPIRATKGKYGKHGGLIGATGDIIRESWPEAVSSGVIAVALEGLLDLTFSSHKSSSVTGGPTTRSATRRRTS